ncbi:hypothetical protein BS78_07G091400 [Paspalum vaginatum]|nr:hypothetical protein BS78_07G091400 [Paspalum vaginatum]
MRFLTMSELDDPTKHDLIWAGVDVDGGSDKEPSNPHPINSDSSIDDGPSGSDTSSSYDGESDDEDDEDDDDNGDNESSYLDIIFPFRDQDEVCFPSSQSDVEVEWENQVFLTAYEAHLPDSNDDDGQRGNDNDDDDDEDNDDDDNYDDDHDGDEDDSDDNDDDNDDNGGDGNRNGNDSEYDDMTLAKCPRLG